MSLRPLLVAACLASSVAVAFPVTVNGNPQEWPTRLPATDNLGLVVRDSSYQGAFVWRDAPNDARTDLATPEVVGDIVSFSVTGGFNNLYFLIQRQSGVAFTGSPIQVQVAIDLDRVAGSGQEYFAGFADTRTSNAARWERLVQTQFGSGGTAQVLDTSFNQVAMAQAVVGAGGAIEISVPWTALGFSFLPTSPLRFTVAIFRSQSDDLTVDIGGPGVSNAIDVVSNYGDPVAAMFPNTYAEVQDQVVDYSFDVWFHTFTVDVITPLVVQRLVPAPAAGGSDEWYAVRNVSSSTLALDGFRLGDEETVDGTEGMFSFPAGATLAPGASYVVARNGASYAAFFGRPPDAELPPGSSMTVPDMVPFTAWTAGVPSTATQMQLANAGDELLVLDSASTIQDVVVYGTGAFSGVTAFTPAPGNNETLARKASLDTDNCQVDYANLGAQCLNTAACGVCRTCTVNACEFVTNGVACADSNLCNGTETCNGAGACVAGTPLDCNDTNACTTDSCTPATGCANAPVAAGTACSDSDLCNGMETCNATGTCVAGAPLDCNDTNVCTSDSCTPALGCMHAPVAAGSSCADSTVCNGAETCNASGVCVMGQALQCDDANACTADSCDVALGCGHVPVADGTACASMGCSGTCMAGACVCPDAGTGGGAGGGTGGGATGGGTGGGATGGGTGGGATGGGTGGGATGGGTGGGATGGGTGGGATGGGTGGGATGGGGGATGGGSGGGGTGGGATGGGGGATAGGCGCATGGELSSLWLALMLGLALSRRGRLSRAP